MNAVDQAAMYVKLAREPIELARGIGVGHEAVTTSSDLAQAYYDQGLAYLYAYAWINAARSFHRALLHDPKLAMAHLGLSCAFSAVGNTETAIEEQQKAELSIPFISQHERLRIQLHRKQLEARAAELQGSSDKSYMAALKEALAANPSDVQLLLLIGNASEGSAWGRGQHGARASINFYLRVTALDSSNAVAHHYLAHSYELLNDIDSATREAHTFVSLAPGLAHAHHMYGHELLRRSQIRDAIREFQEADRIQEADFTTNRNLRVYDWHYRHNLNLLAAAYREGDNIQLTERTLRKLERLPCVTSMDQYYHVQLSIVLLLQAGLSAGSLSKPTPCPIDSGEIGSFLQHTIAGMSLVRAGKSSAAGRELKISNQLLKRVPSDWQSILEPWNQIFNTEIGIKRMEPKAATKKLISQMKSLSGYSGTDAWADRILQLESLGRIALEAKLWRAVEFAGHRLETLAPGCSSSRSLLSAIRLTHSSLN